VSHKISIEGSTLRFAAGHFATFDGDLEPLHGHNYQVSVEIAGSLTADAWVLDFGWAKEAVGAICKELDHKFLLQRDSRELVIEQASASYVITFGGRRYVMPVGDVVPLPIDNTTAERLAEWLAGRIAESLAEVGQSNLDSITVGVEEAPGQSGWYTEALR